MWKTIYIAVVVVVAAAMTACHHTPHYPPLLVQADSAFMRGDYAEADSLLAAYDRLGSQDNEKVQMFRKLLEVEQQYVRGSLNDANFASTDSLMRYYEDRDATDEWIKAMLCLANIYRVSADYPSALDCYLKAMEKSVNFSDNTVLLCWIYQDIGDLYFDQRMYDECQFYYRQFYQMAVSRHDTLRAAHAAARMGLVSTINSESDSVVYYYQKALSYCKRIPQTENIVATSIHNLCDIYIQTEQFDSALSIMPRNQSNLDNWAYWHLGKNNTDSASFYFRQLLNTDNLYAKAEYLRVLIKIGEDRGDIYKVLDYYNELINTEDSIRSVSQTEETRRIKAQYNFNSIRQERDSMAKRHQTAKRTLWLLGVGGIAVLAVIANVWMSYKRKKERELAHEKIMRQRKESQYQQSRQQLQDNKFRIEELTLQMGNALQQNDQEKAKRIELETEILSIKNKEIETVQRRQEYMMNEFESSELYMHLKTHDDKVAYRLSDAEWEQLGGYIDSIYEHFTARLLALSSLSQTELRICYLVKIGVTPTRMTSLLFITKSAIAKVRSRLYRKLTGQQGSSKQLDELIQSF